MLPCVIFEDDHLLAVNKPAGMNTHAPDPFAGEGIYDWLKNREQRWSELAIIHRLDKETSGVLVFSKSAIANRSLTEQFTRRKIEKRYFLLTDRLFNQRELTVKSRIARADERYKSGAKGEPAETRFKIAAGDDVRGLISMPEIGRVNPEMTLEPPYVGSYNIIEANPLTGRTHQIRVHAAENGFPILGDALYGGAPAQRLCLHAAELTLRHPVSGAKTVLRAPADFAADARLGLRGALVDPRETDAYRVIHGASDGWPGWYVDKLGNFLVSESETSLTKAQDGKLAQLANIFSARGAYHSISTRRTRGALLDEASPRLVLGEPAPERFTISENGLVFELSFREGCSVGLFLDQRDNRRRMLTGHLAAGVSCLDPRLETQPPKFQLLNAFAYTCGFSVCAAKAGARTTSLDLSKKYLDWGRRNFALNGLDPATHEFIYGDAFDWLRRLAKKERAFDVVVLDPPTFSQSKGHGAFRVEKDFGKLVSAALPLLKKSGTLFVSTNASEWPPRKFLAAVESAVRGARRKILRQQYIPQPPDFPVSRAEPAYLKTVWLRVD